MAQTKIRATTQIAFDGTVDIGGKKFTNVGTPSNPSDVATKSYVDAILSAQDALVYKGVIDCSGNPNYPAGNAGDTYKVSVSGTIGGVSGVSVIAGDMIICTTDGTASGDQATVGANWNVVHTNGTAGSVTSSSSSVNDNSIARMDGTSGQIIQKSSVTIDDSGSINVPSGQSYKIGGNAITQDNIPDGSTYKQYSSTDKTKLAGIESNADITDAGNVGSAIDGSSAKTTPIDTDLLAMLDSGASNVLKKLSWSNIKATLATYFNTLYVPLARTINGKALSSNVSLSLASADFANQGSTSTVLHGNASGNPSFGAVATADITDSNVTNAKLASMATSTIKGRMTAGTGAPEDITIANLKTMLALVKADVGLSNVDNTSDANKPISTATQTALNAKANLSNWIPREIPAGTKNGSNTIFTIANTPVTGSEMLFVNGQLMDAGASNDYTISGTTITLAVAPLSTDKLLITYWRA